MPPPNSLHRPFAIMNTEHFRLDGLHGGRLTIYLMPKLIAVFALIATITRYTASAAKNLRSRSRTNSITAPTLISFEHYTQLLETSTLKPESYGQWPKL